MMRSQPGWGGRCWYLDWYRDWRSPRKLALRERRRRSSSCCEPLGEPVLIGWAGVVTEVERKDGVQGYANRSKIKHNLSVRRSHRLGVVAGFLTGVAAKNSFC